MGRTVGSCFIIYYNPSINSVIKNTKTGKTYAKFTGSKKVTKKGKYSVTVTDNMGNKKTVKFTVK